ncbi:bifunctional 2',3'-cyclic-nucleotide 2'-phosphodiesterase/3'-nucleotidase [uncultured Ferrimonas sp.]|uniref:bifunctional 2',3'-cyclic-nucleotide 2'-phosphodiesterase/3'-nucleotidase n=1 Tax=uncultured Ferrimonas sp. TaxID=432640 RepID=UPI00261EB2B3|nr:bifunctional 2',3'-cyclic-nucleotide 2'-phosphodiesterase/3'-nucleotidase [uncultured Ferrimonas sp.]
MNKLPLSLALACGVLSGCQSQTEAPTVTAQLRILETSDIHANVMDYDYYQGRDDLTIGLVRTAAMLAAARSEVSNSVLVDNGDLIQGSPMGDYFAAANKGKAFAVHPAHRAMNTMGYAVGNLGNHEFNYGLDFLQQAIDGAQFPYINANVVCNVDCGGKAQGEQLFTPYRIIATEITANDGSRHQLNIGYIGFVPPQIMLWDKRNLTAANGEPRVTVMGIVDAAQKFVPQMQAEGADLIIAIPHSGVGSSSNPTDAGAENAVHALTTVAGIDAILFGHSHSVFPSQRFASQAASHNMDLAKGTINGVAAVMPGRWGDNLGQIDLTLRQQNGQWQVVDSQSQARAIYLKNDQGKKVAATEVTRHQARSAQLRALLASEHHATIDYVNAPLGQSSADMFSFLSLVQDDPTMQIVSNAQLAYAEQHLAPALRGMPVLSAVAPFKAGGRHSTLADADSYTQVAKGQLTVKSAADLYLYPNTLVALKVTGAEVKQWLECSANQFNQIDPSSRAPQALINWNGHRTYNFDVIDGVSYQWDLTQPSRYNGECEQVSDGNRVVNLSYRDGNGKVIRGDQFAQQPFVVITNNYRAFGGSFAGTGGDFIAQEFPDMNRDAVAAYIKANQQVDPSADNNWSFAPINGQVDVHFETQHSAIAAAFIKANQAKPMTQVGQDELGFAVYRLDMSQ